MNDEATLLKQQISSSTKMSSTLTNSPETTVDDEDVSDRTNATINNHLDNDREKDEVLLSWDNMSIPITDLVKSSLANEKSLLEYYK